MTEQEVIEALGVLTDELERLDARREQIYAERLALWVSGSEDLGIRQVDLGAACRVSEGAVTQALRKRRLSEGRVATNNDSLARAAAVADGLTQALRKRRSTR